MFRRPFSPKITLYLEQSSNLCCSLFLLLLHSWPVPNTCSCLSLSVTSLFWNAVLPHCYLLPCHSSGATAWLSRLGSKLLLSKGETVHSIHTHPAIFQPVHLMFFFQLDGVNSPVPLHLLRVGSREAWISLAAALMSVGYYTHKADKHTDICFVEMKTFVDYAP